MPANVSGLMIGGATETELANVRADVVTLLARSTSSFAGTKKGMRKRWCATETAFDGVFVYGNALS